MLTYISMKRMVPKFQTPSFHPRIIRPPRKLGNVFPPTKGMMFSCKIGTKSSKKKTKKGFTKLISLFHPVVPGHFCCRHCWGQRPWWQKAILPRPSPWTADGPSSSARSWMASALGRWWPETVKLLTQKKWGNQNGKENNIFSSVGGRLLVRFWPFFSQTPSCQAGLQEGRREVWWPSGVERRVMSVTAWDRFRRHLRMFLMSNECGQFQIDSVAKVTWSNFGRATFSKKKLLLYIYLLNIIMCINELVTVTIVLN